MMPTAEVLSWGPNAKRSKTIGSRISAVASNPSEFAVNPCQFTANPCPFAANPCQFPANLCQFTANPCPLTANPCQFMANPCGGRHPPLSPLAERISSATGHAPCRLPTSTQWWGGNPSPRGDGAAVRSTGPVYTQHPTTRITASPSPKGDGRYQQARSTLAHPSPPTPPQV
jgi:hypothetical protein